MNKSIPKPKPTEEEIRRQQARALVQQRNSMLQQFMMTVAQANPIDVLKAEGADAISYFCATLADAAMEQMYGVPKTKEDE